MADLKLSELTYTSSLTSADYLLLTQAGSSVKIDVSAFLKTLPVRPIVVELPETVASGVLSSSTLTSKVTTAVTPVTYTLASSSVHGSTKEIIVGTFVTSGTAILTVTGGTGFTTITFNSALSSVSLKNISGSWRIMSAYSVVVA